MKYVLFAYSGADATYKEAAFRFESLDRALIEVSRLLPVTKERRFSSSGPLEWGGHVSFDEGGITQISITGIDEWKEPWISSFANPKGITSILIQRNDVAAAGESGRVAEGNKSSKITDAA